MTCQNDVMDILSRLSYVNTAFAPVAGEIAFLVSELVRYPYFQLRRMVELWLHDARYYPQSKYFPRIAEMLDILRWLMKERPERNLREEAVWLEDDYFFRGMLDKDSWEALVQSFVFNGRLFGAMRLKERYKIYSGLELETEVMLPDVGEWTAV